MKFRRKESPFESAYDVIVAGRVIGSVFRRVDGVWRAEPWSISAETRGEAATRLAMLADETTTTKGRTR